MTNNLGKNAAETIRSLVEKTASLERELGQYKRGLDKACTELIKYRKKEQAEKVADRMIQLGVLAETDRREKVAELLDKEVDLSQMKLAVEHFNPNNAWGSLDVDSGPANNQVKTSKELAEDLFDYLRS